MSALQLDTFTNSSIGKHFLTAIWIQASAVVFASGVCAKAPKKKQIFPKTSPYIVA